GDTEDFLNEFAGPAYLELQSVDFSPTERVVDHSRDNDLRDVKSPESSFEHVGLGMNELPVTDLQEPAAFDTGWTLWLDHVQSTVLQQGDVPMPAATFHYPGTLAGFCPLMFQHRVSAEGSACVNGDPHF